MGKLKKSGFKYGLCFITGITLGILMGMAILSILVSYRMDMSYQRIAYLESTIQDKDSQLEKLEESINTQSLILKDIEVLLVFDGDEIDKISIEKTVKEKYRSLLGKKVEEIDGDIIGEVVDNRILMIENKEYKIHVDKLILTEVLKIWITIESI